MADTTRTPDTSHAFFFDSIPQEMRQYRQWVVWQLVQKDGKPKPDKIPITPNTGAWASVSDSSTWGTFEAALEAYVQGGGRYGGIGFIFTRGDPFAFIDLDNVKTDAGWDPVVSECLAAMTSWAEYSQSGSGVHIICKATGDSAKGAGKELYTHGRFVAMTGRHITNTPTDVKDCQEGVDWFRNLIRAEGGRTDKGPAEKPTDPESEAVERNLRVLQHKPGKLEIECPWGYEHANGDPTGAVYMAAHFNGRAEANFYCQHATCQGHGRSNIGSLRAWLREQDEDYAREMFVSPEAVFGPVASEDTPDTPQSDPDEHPWGRLKIGDMVRTQAPPLDLLVEGIVPAKTVCSLVGPPGQGKTQFAIQLGISVVTGQPAFGNPAWAVPAPGATLILDCEDPRNEVHRRIQATIRHSDFSEDDLEAMSERLAYFYPEGKDVRMIDSGGHATGVVDQIIKMINTAPQRLQLLVLGPTINLLTGDENDNAQMQALMNTWHRISSECGLTVVGIHHTTKQATLQAGRTQTSARGAGAFSGSVRAMLYLQNMIEDEGKKHGIIDGTHTQWCGVSLVKANGMRIFEKPVWLERSEDSAFMQYTDEQPEMNVKDNGKPTLEREMEHVSTVARDLMSTVTEPMKVRTIADSQGGLMGPFGMGTKRVRQLLIRACDEGLLAYTVRDTPTGASYELLPQGPAGVPDTAPISPAPEDLF